MRTTGLDREKQPLPLAAGGRPAADEPRGHDPRVVDNHEIAGGKQVGKVADVPVLERAGGPPHNKQAGGSPVGERLLRDQVSRQVVVVAVGLVHELVRCGLNRGKE